MIVIGLTGSIGMGKSTTAAVFAGFGDAVHDADATVHRLYAAGGDAVEAVEALFPGVIKDGAVDRRRLAARVLDDPQAIAALEAAVHPLVRAAETAFLASARARRARFAVLDIPLLFETRREHAVDAIVVVSAPPEVQRARVALRPGMTEERFATLLARQLPDAQKRRRAHFVIDTSGGLAHARLGVAAVRRALSGMSR